MESCKSLRKFLIASKVTAALFCRGIDTMTSFNESNKRKGMGNQIQNYRNSMKKIGEGPGTEGTLASTNKIGIKHEI